MGYPDRIAYADFNMQYALVDGIKSLPSKNLSGLCQCCLTPVVSKCGNINIHHWSHLTLSDCDGCKDETRWHRDHKKTWLPDFQERVFEDKQGNRRIADIMFGNKVFEFESRHIEPKILLDRDSFWRRNGFTPFWVFRCDEKMSERLYESYRTKGIFRFKYGWKRLLRLPKPFAIDFADKIFYCKSYWCFNENNRIYIKGEEWPKDGLVLNKERQRIFLENNSPLQAQSNSNSMS